MTDATDLWTAVKADYDAEGLISLTNIRDRSATAVNDSVGQQAAQSVINLWPIYAEEDYAGTDSTQVEVAGMGVIAMLWRRGGTASTIEKVKWDEVFSPEGLIARVRRTGARGRGEPSSNSGVSQKAEGTSSGGQVRGWSDVDSLPTGWMPRRRNATGD